MLLVHWSSRRLGNTWSLTAETRIHYIEFVSSTVKAKSCVLTVDLKDHMLDNPSSVAVDKDGSVYVDDEANDHLVVLTSTLEFIQSLPSV